MKTTMRMTMKTMLVFCVFCANLWAEEAILDFHSEVVVERSGVLTVTERIKVRVEGKEIKRGIFRDFPQLYQIKWGLTERRPFEVLSATRNGEPEPFEVKREKAGTRVYLGEESVILPRNSEQVYEIKYQTSRQLLFSEKQDELYWNVTGNEWSFPIEKASATVVLPEGIEAIELNAYTGEMGSKAQNASAEIKNDHAFFETSARLGQNQGLTISVIWPPGQLDAAAYEKPNLLLENKTIVFGIFLIFAGFSFWLIAWIMVGRDPRQGLIIPRWEPPAGWSAASVRYLQQMKFDNKNFTAGVLALAAKGRVKISEKRPKVYQLERGEKKDGELHEDEQELYQGLLRARESITLENKNHAVVGGARKQLAKTLKQKIRGRFFKGNVGVWLLGLVTSLLGLVFVLLKSADPGATFFMLIWLSIWSAGTSALVMQAVSTLRAGKLFSGLGTVLFAIPFALGWLAGVYFLFKTAGLLGASSFVFIIILAIAFYHLMKAPTKEGRLVLDEIDGFREYLKVAEEDRLNLENPPEKTPELFEKFLPYALALGVEQQWSEKFNAVLKAASAATESGNYQPSFYSGTRTGMDGMMTGAALGAALTNALTTASSAPSSSGGGGGGGGGSSGGGGGGGGGGGW